MRERWIDVDDLRVYAIEWSGSSTSTNDPVLLVHGLGGNTVSWELIGQALAERLDTRVTAVDLAGFGRTRLPSGRATIARNADLVTRVLELEGPAVLMGNSMGGAISVYAAARRPELTRGLVLVDSALPGRPSTWAHFGVAARFSLISVPRVGEYLVDRRSNLLGAAGLVDATLEVILAHPDRLDAEIHHRLIELGESRHDYDERIPAYTSAARSLVAHLARPMRQDISAVRAATLMLHGALDKLVPIGLAHATITRRPDWELTVFDDCGHAPQLEQPERFLDTVVDWFDARMSRALGA